MAKKWLQAAVTLLCVCVLLSGCGNKKNQNLVIKSGSLESLSLASSPIEAVVALSIENKAYKVDVSNLRGSVKKGERALLHLEGDNFTVPARSNTVVKVPVHATLEKGVGYFDMIRLASARDLSDITVSLSFTGQGLFGITREIEYKDVPIADMMKK